MKRGKPLKRGKWRAKRDNWRHQVEAHWLGVEPVLFSDPAEIAATRAKTYGCEYGEHLREMGRQEGCVLCGRRWRRIELHHVRTRRRGGQAEHQVPLCYECHQRGHIEGWKGRQEGLYALAAELAGQAVEAGLLPVYPCGECGVWHSVRYTIEERWGSSVVRRVCLGCAPEGPP